MASRSKNGGRQPISLKQRYELEREQFTGNRHSRRRAKAMLRAKRISK